MGGIVSRYRAIDEETSTLSMLEQLPEGPLSEIASHLDTQSLSRLARSSSYFARFFKNHLDMAKAIKHVLRGQETAILAMLEKSPELLLAKGRAVDYSGREYYSTPFQAAFLSHYTILCKKMEPFFDKLPDGRAKLAEQARELFPNAPPDQTAFDLTNITKAISDSPDTDIKAICKKKKKETPIYKQITSFRQQFTAVSLEEKFFNIEHLIKAVNIFDQHYARWTDWQCGAFFSLVIGYIQRFLPAFYAHAYRQGLRNVNLKEENFERSLVLDDGSVMFPLEDDSLLGFDYGMHSFGFQRWYDAGQPCRLEIDDSWAVDPENFFRANTSDLYDLWFRLSDPGAALSEQSSLRSIP